MTSQEYIKYATNFLKSASIHTARLDTLVLMEYVLGIDRSKLLAEPDHPIKLKELNVLNKLLERRATHEPIAYITQSSEFYGRSFYVNNHVLEARPESETMIDLLKTLISSNKAVFKQPLIRLADVGTGSGALGITAMLECPNLSVDLIDIDSKALAVAKKNVVLHTIRANALRADLLSYNDVIYDILLCNLPYVPDEFSINLAAGHEPKIAIFGGKDGLDVYRKLFKLVSNRQHKPLYILTESLPGSHKALRSIAKSAGYELSDSEDFIQRFALSN